MRIDDLKKLFEYTYWAHGKMWECVLQLSDEDFDSPSDYSVGSVHDQVVHMMAAEWLWLQRMLGQTPDGLPPTEKYPTRAEINAEWKRVEQAWHVYLNTLTDDMLDNEIVYMTITDKREHQSPLWVALMQVINHGTDHRAQTLALLHRLEVKTPAQDWIYYAWEAMEKGK